MSCRGFSRADALVLLAMASILAAVAVPNLLALRMQAVRAELPINVEAIRTAELAYRAGRDTYLRAAPHPRQVPGPEPVSWPWTNQAFEELGFAPDGAVRGVYEVTDATSWDFMVTGTIDADGDGEEVVCTASRVGAAALRLGDERRY